MSTLWMRNLVKKNVINMASAGNFQQSQLFGWLSLRQLEIMNFYPVLFWPDTCFQFLKTKKAHLNNNKEK